MADSKDSFLWAVKQQESGGNYNAVNSGSGALGAYQVMPANVPSWTRQALGRSLTPAQFLADPSAQDAVARSILGGYYDKYGASGAASMWYSGQPDPTKNYGTPPVSAYVAQVLSRMNTSSPVGTPGTTQTGLTSDLGGVLADGLQQGLIVAFKSIMGPLFKWGFWFMETGIGFAAVVVGALLMAQKSDTVRSVEAGMFKTAAPEAAPAVTTVEKGVDQSQENKRKAAQVRDQERRNRESAQKTREELKTNTTRQKEAENVRLARAKRILEPKDYREYRKEQTGR